MINLELYKNIYEVESTLLNKSECEKDLGLYIKNDLKWDTQVEYVTAKANRILGMLKKSFKYPNVESIKLLYTSLVRPHLEYANSSWCPYLKKDLEMLEKIQRRATKLVPNIKRLNYQDRLSVFGLTDLKTRRMRGDLIQMYKITNKIEKIKLVNGVNFSVRAQGYNLRRHSKNLHRELVKNCPSRFNFLVNRVANVWNELPEEVVSACTINSFKSKLDVWMKAKTASTAIAH